MAPQKRTDPARADERAAETPKPKASRIDGAVFLGGAWVAADGTPLTNAEAQQAHRAADAKAAAAAERVRLGVTE